MAGWRQVIELAMTDEEIGRLGLIARSRSESASRVERAQMLLAYRQKPKFFARGGSCTAPAAFLLGHRASCEVPAPRHSNSNPPTELSARDPFFQR
jgi:hypothetical protein